MHYAKKERHGKQTPTGGLEQSRRGHVLAPHSQTEHQRPSLGRVPEELNGDLAVSPVDDSLGDGQLKRCDRQDAVSNFENLAFQNAPAHRLTVVHGDETFLKQRRPPIFGSQAGTGESGN